MLYISITWLCYMVFKKMSLNDTSAKLFFTHFSSSVPDHNHVTAGNTS